MVFRFYLEDRFLISLVKTLETTSSLAFLVRFLLWWIPTFSCCWFRFFLIKFHCFDHWVKIWSNFSTFTLTSPCRHSLDCWSSVKGLMKLFCTTILFGRPLILTWPVLADVEPRMYPSCLRSPSQSTVTLEPIRRLSTTKPQIKAKRGQT